MAEGRAHSGALPYVAALDGLRGLAIAAVLVFHADPRWLPGGMLGITVFFTLSGFLITALIVSEIDVTGRLDLRAFWLRRARRLVPASLAAVALIALLARTGGAGVPGRDLVYDAVAALTWTANWRFVASGTSYAEVFQDPSPFQHFWSLAVEEQLYLALPLLAVGLLARGSRSRVPLALVLGAGVVASVAAGVLLHVPGAPPGRAYYGTDARIAEPLVGALLALLLVRGGGLPRFSPRASRLAGALGIAGLAAVAWLMIDLSTVDDRLHRGGLLATALAAAAIVLASTQATAVARLLGAQPLVALGRISYGVYLFHWPVYLWLGDRMASEDRLTVVAAQVTTTLVLAAFSYSLLELPIRLRGRGGAVFAVGWANASVAVVAAVALSASVITVQAGEPVDLGASADAPVPPPPVATTVVAAPAAGGERGVRAQAAAAAVPAGPAVASPESTVDVENDPVVQGNATPDKGPAPPPASDEPALRVAVIGDSLGHNVAVGLGAWGEARGDVLVYNLAMSACPMSRGGDRRFDEYETFPVNPKCGWWAEPWSERAEEFAAFDPDVVVIEASLNELLDRRLAEWGEWRRPGDPAYHSWLIDEYTALFDALRDLAGEDTELVLLNAVCADFDRHVRWRKVEDTSGRVTAMNRSVFPFMVEAVQGDLFSEVCPNGEYSDDLWGIEDARPDGIHLSDEAATELAWRWLGPLVLDVAADEEGTIIGAGRP